MRSIQIDCADSLCPRVRASIRALVVGSLLLACSSPGSAWAVSINEYTIPTASSRPYGITAGPDGNLWFVENSTDKIGRITPAGAITEFPLAPSSGPNGITVGPDGNLWFTETKGAIGRITRGGAITEFPIPASSGFCTPLGITAGPDGNVWFVASPTFCAGLGGAGISKGYVVRVTMGGAIRGFALSSFGTAAYEITAGPDGNLWFTAAGLNGYGTIGRITPAGVITEFPLPGGVQGLGITAGPDGNLWFAEAYGANKIGRITPAGAITEFSVPSLNGPPAGISSGADGNLWFTGNNGYIGQITPSGAITEFEIPTASSNPFRITSGPDGNLWFTESGASKIGQVVLGVGSGVSAPTTLHPLTPCRLIDTRNPGPLNVLAGPALVAHARRDFTIGDTNNCGVPLGAVAISANLTVTNVGAQGELVVFPSDILTSNTYALCFQAGRTRANNAVVSFSKTSATFSVFNDSAATVDFIVDVNGYFQ